MSGLIAVDAIARERDESSLPVVALAEMSAAGYILRRWIAVMVIVIPVTLVPRLVSAGFAAFVTKSLPPAAPFLLGWALRVLPIVVIVSALFMALGTITGRTVLAIIFVVLLPTVVLGITNDILAYAGRKIEMSDVLPQGVTWILRGWSRPSSTTDAAFSFTPLVDELFVQYGPPLVVALVALGLSLLFLRRTRRDLKPWPERENHPLRSMIRVANRLRHEYAPDAGFQRADLVAVAACLLLALLAGGALVQRDTHFMKLADERFIAETATRPAPLPLTIVPVSVTIDGEVARSGAVQTTSAITLRNDGSAPVGELSFAINGMMTIERVTSDRGTAALDRKWERVGVAIEPPLAPRETRTITFALRGTPAAVTYRFGRGRTYQEMYRIYRKAKTTIDLVDFSKTTVEPYADETGLNLTAADLTPIPRYTPWTPFQGDRYEVLATTFIDDLLAPIVRMRVALRVPGDFTAADSCGASSSNGAFTSDCTYAISEYRLAGAPLTTMPLGGQLTFAYIPAHEKMARIHGPVIADAVEVAKRSWPGLDFSGRTVIMEKPTGAGDWYDGDVTQHLAIRSIEASGRLVGLPELMLVRMEPVDRGVIASAIVANRLRQRRPFVPEEEPFFERFFIVMANSRIAGKNVVPVHLPRGPRPSTNPILETRGFYYGEGRASRMEMVLAHLEQRVGSDRLIEGVNDFLSASGKPGTAKEMLQAIGRRAGISLDRVYSDYFTGDALPRLTFENVTFVRSGSRLGSARRRAQPRRRRSRSAGRAAHRAGSRAADAYASTRGARRRSRSRPTHAPRTLQLDPDSVCYRLAAIGRVDSRRLQGGES